MAEFEELVREINSLKSEIERLREVVTALFQMIVETNEFDYEAVERIRKDISFNN